MTRVFRDRTVLLLVLLLAFLIRFLGIFHDLPFSYYPDEEHFVKRSLAFGNGDFNPHWFNKPALYMYLLFFEYIFLFFFGKLVGSWNNINDYAIFYINHKGVFYFIGRLTTVSFGIGVIYLVYRIGKEFYDEYIGIISAVIVAFTFGHYESAIQVKADMPATFFTLASLLFVYRLYRQGRVTDYLLAGVLGGLGMATKYYSLALLFPFAVAHYLRGHASRRFSLRRLLDGKLVLAYFAFLGGFFLGSPFNFLDPTWAQYYILPRLHTLLGLKHLDPEIVTRALPEMNWRVFLGSLWHYGRTVVSPRGMGLSIGLLSLAGLLYCSLLGVRDKKYWVVVAFPWFFILLANYVNPYYSEPRHQLVVYPLLALCGAVLLRDGLERLRTLWPLWPQSAVVPYAIAAALVVAVPAWHIATDVAIILQPDPRTLAKAWIETHIPDGTKLVLDEYTPPFAHEPQEPLGALRTGPPRRPQRPVHGPPAAVLPLLAGSPPRRVL
ncbi:MAG: hypothetical protein KatS3mg131_3804 [Candidatus Tectimicrobiota bacterium]|nr:MAG: hypothetical protein KatS3mg131_3804 [Candidatus Tectomicrobia bacterium]